MISKQHYLNKTQHPLLTEVCYYNQLDGDQLEQLLNPGIIEPSSHPLFILAKDRILSAIEKHENGFVHRDLRRPSDMPGLTFDNIFLTPTGLRLIDVGISALQEQVGERLFNRFVQQELAELELFRSFFLSR